MSASSSSSAGSASSSTPKKQTTSKELLFAEPKENNLFVVSQPQASTKPKYEPSSLLSKTRDFLPLLKKANEDLLSQIQQNPSAVQRIDTRLREEGEEANEEEEEEQAEEGEDEDAENEQRKMVEFNLALGVLEPKKDKIESLDGDDEYQDDDEKLEIKMPGSQFMQDLQQRDEQQALLAITKALFGFKENENDSSSDEEDEDVELEFDDDEEEEEEKKKE